MLNAGRSGLVDHAIVVVMMVGLVAGAYAGISLASGGEDDTPSAEDIAAARLLLPRWGSPNTAPLQPYETMPPRNPGMSGFSVPTQGPTPTWPASVEISGVVIPIPEGWHHVLTNIGGGSSKHLIWKGESSSRQTESGPVSVGVRFDDFGLTYINVDPPEEAEAEATLDALWDLTQTVMTLSPATASVAGQDVPLAAGSYYRVTEKPFIPGEVGTFRVAYRHSVLFFDEHGVIYARVGSGDEARFQPAIDAIEILAPVD